MTQENVLTLHGFRYFRWSLLLSVAAIVAYLLDDPPVAPYGGTWLGYTLGTVGALIIVWLILFGARKRAYRSNLGSLRGWLSAHIWLGIALLVIGTLHTGFQFGWNIHTIAYILMLLVIFSGIWGVTVYLRNPALLSEMIGGKSLQQHGVVLAELDAESRNLAQKLGPDVQQLIEASARAPIVGGVFGRFAAPASCATANAVTQLQQIGLSGDKAIRNLYAVQVRRQQQLERIRGFLRLKAWTDLWLLIHVPVSIGLLATLTAHIVSVFFYW